MADLRVTYLGLKLENPIVVSSSSLTNTAEKVLQAAEAGAGAVVLKSLFEEEIQAEIDAGSRESYEHTEAADYIRSMETDAGLKRYKSLIRASKESVKIPVIASINAVDSDWWIQHVPALEAAGADALELNISLLPGSYTKKDNDVLAYFVNTVKAVRKAVSIPISVKIGQNFSSIPAIVDALKWAGADGVVLFNRFYQLDFDIDKLEVKSGAPFTRPQDISVPLRWISLLYGHAGVEIAASSGIHDGKGVIKALLAGAQVAQVCSTVYRNGLDQIGAMRNELSAWMDEKQFKTVSDFRGKLSRKSSKSPESYERLQYIKALVGRA